MIIARCTFRIRNSHGYVAALRFRRGHATATITGNSADRTRNIGIIAHIDAGKTTTTERMLYYAGFTRQIGDVDEGSTITDFLPAERARGITIQSAAISFSWPPKGTSTSSPVQRSSIPHNINLIDTPGHADFTFEVLRSLRVLDGAVCILDSVAGVEAQTEKVWAQASAYEIPRLIFVNKLDRDGASFEKSVHEIGSKLNIWPALCTIPWWDAQGSLKGVGDVVDMRALQYVLGGDGKHVSVLFGPDIDETFAATLRAARTALVELLAEHDDEMVELFLAADEDHLKVSPQNVRDSLRRCTLMSPQPIAPVYAGASFRNVGVQPLLDSVVDLLPSPLERSEPTVSAGAESKALSAFLQAKLEIAKSSRAQKQQTAIQVLEACALAFKVVNDPRRGILVYVRVYQGSVNKNSLLWNTNLQASERAQRLLRMYANDAIDIDEIEAGQIGVIPGLKLARTGDSLIVCRGATPKTGPFAPVSQLQLRPIEVPPPVFFVSVEPNSLAEERHVRESLAILLREDPSLNISVDEETGQTHLAGMGELHLEIARDRLIQDLRAKARVGSIEISYREAVSIDSGPIAEVYEREIGGRISKAGCVAEVVSDEGSETSAQGLATRLADNNSLMITMAADSADLDEDAELSRSVIMQALHNGVLGALARGPTHGYPVHSTAVHLTFNREEHAFHNTTVAALSSVARVAVNKALKRSASKQDTTLMEPVMYVVITVDEGSLGSVVQDISSVRGGSVVSLDDEDSLEDNRHVEKVDLRRIYAPQDPFGSSGTGVIASRTTNMRQIKARVPLKEMIGYLKHLRSLTAGRGTFVMSVDRFDKMSAQRIKAMLGSLRSDHY